MYENYIQDANESIHFKLVTSLEDLQDKEEDRIVADEEYKPSLSYFKPEMSHQFFGEKENIFGYRNLRVNIYYSAARLDIYLGASWDEKLKASETGGVEPDEPLKIIAQDYQTKVFYNLNEFSLFLADGASFKPYGELLQEILINAKTAAGDTERRFVVYQSNFGVPGFLAYHERMQTFLKWFVDAASYIDTDDNKWDLFVVYEKLSSGYVFVGYSSVYRYYVYPSNVRPRISQFLILPPFQRRGIGERLLRAMYDAYNVKSTVDITVEDASDNFQRLRDVLETKLCRTLATFAPEKLRAGWTKQMGLEAQQKFKINIKQARRIYEILRLGLIDRDNPEEYRTFRLEIKQRLNAPYQNQLNDLALVRKKHAMSEEKYNKMLSKIVLPKEARHLQLQHDYQIIEEDYDKVLQNIAHFAQPDEKM